MTPFLASEDFCDEKEVEQSERWYHHASIVTQISQIEMANYLKYDLMAKIDHLKDIQTRPLRIFEP